MVNKQGEWTMKTAIKYFWPFGCFRIKGQKLGLLLVTKYIKNQSYPNMSPIKVGLPFLNFFFIEEYQKRRPTFIIYIF